MSMHRWAHPGERNRILFASGSDDTKLSDAVKGAPNVLYQLSR